jgi:hypothetical protein
VREYVYGETDAGQSYIDYKHPIVRCKDCVHSRSDGNECAFFSADVPIPGGDEFEERNAYVGQDGYCAWGEKR